MPKAEKQVAPSISRSEGLGPAAGRLLGELHGVGGLSRLHRLDVFRGGLLFRLHDALPKPPLQARHRAGCRARAAPGEKSDEKKIN